MRSLTMKSGAKQIRIGLVIAIVAAILISSACACYYTVAAADFLSPILNFENVDQEFLMAAHQNEFKMPRLGGSSYGCRPETFLYEEGLPLFFQMSTPDRKTLILRC
jgi:hypothetical protein